ncbi:MAG: T9SS type A sorting domain-containing protein [Cytophagaceae bacterium]|nr:T9SS type A sorting domain-containing protein [Cytophagaceae bacterium]
MFLLLAATLAQMLAGRVFAQSDRNKSRLDIKPRPRSEAVAPAKLNGFSLLRNPPVKNLNPNRALSINQYYRNLLSAQPAPRQTAVKQISAEPVATPSTVAVVVERNAEEQAASTDKLYSSERLTVSNLYPNPANEYTLVDYSVGATTGQAKLSFFNVLGSPVGEYELDRSERRLRISTSEWTNGIYFYQLALEGRTLATKKLLVRHQ